MASGQQDWQSTKSTVLQRSRYMFNNPLMSDVVLTCEGSDKKFFAHKYVLATSSAVFYAMLYGKLAEKNSAVHLSDTNEESLQEFLRFLYTDACKLKTDNAVFVLYLAKKYIVPSLAQKCIKFIETNITAVNVFTALQHALHFDEKKLENKCWDLIDLNTSKAVASDAFTDINQGTLLQLLKRETLKIREVDLFQAVLRWSEAECSRKEIEGNANNKRNVLGNAIYEIRFASMNIREFAQSTSESGLLTSDEMVLFYEKFNGIEKAVEAWNMSERRACLKEETLLRCSSRFRQYSVSSAYGGKKYHTIGVLFSKPVKILGVRLFGCSKHEYEVTLEVCTQTTTGKFCAEDNGHGYGYDVMLSAPVKVEANAAVLINATISRKSPGSLQYDRYGVHGKTTIEINGITVNFFEVPSTALHENCTSVQKGQFDEIILSE